MTRPPVVRGPPVLSVLLFSVSTAGKQNIMQMRTDSQTYQLPKVIIFFSFLLFKLVLVFFNKSHM